MPDFPTASEVLDSHRNSDLDKRRDAQHHSLGRTRNQASPGDHNHDGGSSALLFPSSNKVIPTLPDGSSDTANPIIPSSTFTQNLDTGQGQKDAIEQIINILQQMGITDNTQQNNGIAPFLTHSIYVNKVLTGTAAVVWGATQQLSSVLTVNFAPVFPAIPRLFLTCRSNSATLQYLAQQTALSATSFDVRVWTTAANTSGNSVPVDWLAILTGTYT